MKLKLYCKLCGRPSHVLVSICTCGGNSWVNRKPSEPTIQEVVSKALKNVNPESNWNKYKKSLQEFKGTLEGTRD